MDLIEEVASDEVMDIAYTWLCQQRRKWSHNDAVWDLRRNWTAMKPALQQETLHGEVRLGPVEVVHTPEGERRQFWSARDALVLKAVAVVLGRLLRPKLSRNCFHLAGRVGGKAAVRKAVQALAQGGHVFKSDVASYYATISHAKLWDMVCEHVPDKGVRRIVWQCLKRTECDKGLYSHPRRGIPLGCPLSPLMGGLYLKGLDEAMENLGVSYCRFMDDWLILAPTRWRLRRCIAVVNRILVSLGLEKHPEKTFVGKASKGFCFLGYHFTPRGLGISEGTGNAFCERICRLYEQGAGQARIGRYVRNWVRWAEAGLCVPLWTAKPRVGGAAPGMCPQRILRLRFDSAQWSVRQDRHSDANRGDANILHGKGRSMGEQQGKPKWKTPKLIEVVQRMPEEGVLDSCQNQGSGTASASGAADCWLQLPKSCQKCA